MDGGTRQLTFRRRGQDVLFHIDHRIGSETEGTLWYGQPGHKGSEIVTDQVIIEKVYQAVREEHNQLSSIRLELSALKTGFKNPKSGIKVMNNRDVVKRLGF